MRRSATSRATQSILPIQALTDRLRITWNRPGTARTTSVPPQPAAAQQGRTPRAGWNTLGRLIGSARQEQSTCRVLLFGHPRSGKTTLLNNVLTVQTSSSPISTSALDIWSGACRIDRDRTVNVAIADYAGAHPSQILVNQDQRFLDFFGPPMQRRIHAILFVVDLFDMMYDEQGNPLSNESIIEQLQDHAPTYLQRRVTENFTYLNKWHIETILALAHNQDNTVQSVRLVINKVDLFQAAVMRGYMPGVNVQNIEGAIRSLYAPLEQTIVEMCAQSRHHVTDFDVHVISATQGTGVNSVFGPILQQFQQRREPQTLSQSIQTPLAPVSSLEQNELHTQPVTLTEAVEAVDEIDHQYQRQVKVFIGVVLLLVIALSVSCVISAWVFT